MDFYNRKARALKLIDSMLDDNKGEIDEAFIDKIEYAVSGRYALGRRIIMKRIELYLRLLENGQTKDS